MHSKKIFDEKITLTTAVLILLLLTTLIVSAQEAPSKQKPADDYLVFLPVIFKKSPAQTIPLFNGDFEQGTTGWQEYSYWGYLLILDSAGLPIPPYSGSWAVWLGGDDGEVSYIRQNLTVPNNAPYLSYWHWIGGAEYACGWDFGGVGVNGEWYHSYDLCEQYHTEGWVQYVVDMSEFKGQTIDLDFVAVTDEEPDTWSNLFIDLIAFNSSAPFGAVELNDETRSDSLQGPYTVTRDSARSSILSSNLQAPSKRR